MLMRRLRAASGTTVTIASHRLSHPHQHCAIAREEPEDMDYGCTRKMWDAHSFRALLKAQGKKVKQPGSASSTPSLPKQPSSTPTSLLPPTTTTTSSAASTPVPPFPPPTSHRHHLLDSNKLIGSLVCEGHIYSLADSENLPYTGSDSKSIRFWKNQKEFAAFKSTSGFVKAIVISGQRIYTGHQDGKIQIWKINLSDLHELSMLMFVAFTRYIQ
ncbi:hypothetical protein MRB53_030783 [Persea americana]|uniref:Uncharacterized protein n=1 Tax=Persea americana TaxID=3435 RepID=A0ACC2KM90_PERAE|nr:hypothetical protein MRB53_030783 [Persea americana]